VGCAEVISLNEVRARTHRTTLRQRLHERFDQWLDQLEAALPEGAPTVGQVSATIWALRQQLTGGVAETIVHHSHPEKQQRSSLRCPTCARRLPARGPGATLRRDPRGGYRIGTALLLLSGLPCGHLSARRGPGPACGADAT
jgi:hypothetical protein